jgi:hypothetical protein
MTQNGSKGIETGMIVRVTAAQRHARPKNIVKVCVKTVRLKPQEMHVA